MDFLTPGLSKLALSQIRQTNTISVKLGLQYRDLVESTNTHLLSASSENLGAEAEPNSVQEIFSDFYYAARLDKPKSEAIPELSLKSLQQFQNRLAKLKNSTEVSATPFSEAESSLVEIIDRFTLIIVFYHLANAIVTKTITVKGNLGYWTDLRLSTYRKLCYGVQTLPARIYSLGLAAFQNIPAQPEFSSVSITSPKLLISSMIHNAAELIMALRKAASDAVDLLNTNFIVRSSRLRWVKMPLHRIDQEIKHKVKSTESQLDAFYAQLGTIINSLPMTEDIFASLLPNADKSVSLIIQEVESYISDDSELCKTAPPGFLTRYWPILFLLVKYGPSTTASVWKSRYDAIDWIKHNLVDTTVGFWKNWIVKPIANMLVILRNDDTMAITSKESLRSDLDSLERMVADFAKDNNINVDPQQVHTAVSRGDLTMMMSQYEHDIRTPYKLIIKGLLIRSMLIQVQKTKVDGAMAISGIDKLLKLQQLLFGVLSILPSLFIVYLVNNALRKDTSLSQDVVSRRISCLKSLNQIEKLVNGEGQGDKLVNDGKLFVEVVSLSLMSSSIIPSRLREEFLRDINELTLRNTQSGSQAINTTNRIWNMYSPFFRRSLV